MNGFDIAWTAGLLVPATVLATRGHPRLAALWGSCWITGWALAAALIVAAIRGDA